MGIIGTACVIQNKYFVTIGADMGILMLELQPYLNFIQTLYESHTCIFGITRSFVL